MADVERETDRFLELLNVTSLSTDVMDNLNRVEEFGNLILLGKREQGSHIEDFLQNWMWKVFGIHTCMGKRSEPTYMAVSLFCH